MIGERIKTLREKQGQSQEELAHLVGMHPNTIARWERGELSPRGTSLSKVARALNTTSTFLLGDTDDPKPSRVDVVPSIDDSAEKRLIIKQGDLYINLPESSEGFDALRRFFDSQAAKNITMSPAVGQA